MNQELADFFTRYGQSLADFDPEASASLWGEPGMLLSDAFVGVLSTRAEMAAGLAAAHPFYRALGLTGVAHTVVEEAVVSERIARVRVRWHFHGKEGHLADSDYEYLLRRDQEGWHAYCAVSIDAEAQLAALAERKGVTLPS